MSSPDLCRAPDYPPTHTYDKQTLEPTGVLAERAAIIERLAPELFKGDRFLDIGCNRGWFALKAALGCRYVLGIDPIEAYTEIAKSKAPENCLFLTVPFAEYYPFGQFDRIFIGNGPHYLFTEAKGWGYIDKLAYASSDLLVTEGPVGMDCADMAACIPLHLQPRFNRQELLEHMNKHWTMVGHADSPAYTPNRHVIKWKRIDDLLHCSMARYADYLRIVYRKMGAWIDPENTVAEICIRHDRGVISREIIECASFEGVDLNPGRCPNGGFQADAIRDKLPDADVYISTAILHHTAKEDIPQLLANIRKYAGSAIFTGPNVEVMPDLIGDHKWHIDMGQLRAMAHKAGWSVVYDEPVGLNAPYSEVLVVMGSL